MRGLHNVSVLCSTALTAIAGTWAIPALADDPSTQSEEEAVAEAEAGRVQSAWVGEIIVTAQKRSESIRDVPMSITALSGDQLRERGISDVADLAKATPGFSYVDSGEAVPVYSLRGVGFFDVSIGARPTVSVYLDQMPLTFSIMSPGASFDLERVEVLKGPQGTLFGSNATGGAINYIAAKPKSNFEAGVDMSYGRFNRFEGSGYVTGPLGSDLNIRISARGVRSDDWQKSYTRDDDHGRERLYQGRMMLDWTPSDAIRFSFTANGFVDKSDTQAGQLVGLFPSRPQNLNDYPLLVNYPLSPTSNRAADWDEGIDFARDNEFYQLSLRSEFDLSDSITLTSLTSYSDIEVDQGIDQDGTDLHNVRQFNQGTASSFVQELRLSGQIGHARWIIGGNYSKDKSDQSSLATFQYATVISGLLPFPGRFQGNTATGSQDFDNKAVFANVDLELGDQFVLHGGVRYTETNLDFTACSRAPDELTAAAVNGFLNLLRGFAGADPLDPPLAANDCITVDANLNPGERTGELDEDNLSWRAGVDFKPAEDMMLYLSISKGYKSGNSPVLNAFAQAALDPVTQESVTAFEGGFKAAFADRRIDLSAAAFYYDYKEKQLKGRKFLTPAVLNPIQTLVNVPKSRIFGVEGQLNIVPVDGLSFTAAGVYIDSKVKGSFPNYSIVGAPADFGGESFPYTPKWQVSGDVGYEFAMGQDMEGFLGSSWNYRSDTTAGFGGEPLLRIKDYAILDLRAGVKSPEDTWRAELFGHNVTNTYYWNNVAHAFDVVRRMAGKPATYGIRVSYKFH